MEDRDGRQRWEIQMAIEKGHGGGRWRAGIEMIDIDGR